MLPATLGSGMSCSMRSATGSSMFCGMTLPANWLRTTTPAALRVEPNGL